MNVTIIGTGYVGVVSAAVFASFGNSVTGLDIDETKVFKLKKGEVPFYEPGLSELLLTQQKAGKLHFTTDYQQAISNAEVIMIAVGTPSKADGQADLKYIFAAVESLAPYLQKDAIVAIKSTVPPGTLDQVKERIQKHTKTPFFVASLPEFLKEGTAVQDSLHPDRVVIGADDQHVFKVLENLHEPLKAPITKISAASAQMAKYSANAYLATRITFINQIADLCEKNGADIQDVIQAIGFDKRIGKHYWYPGFGYGGSCFPKDVKELAAYSRAVGEHQNLFNKINDLNEERIHKLLEQYGKKIGGWDKKKVAILGLSFKPNTDDMREAPSMKVIPELISHGAIVTGFDPKATWPEKTDGFTQVANIQTASKDCDVIMALIEWPEITGFDFSAIRNSGKQWFIDARNQFDPKQIRDWGFEYMGVGRP